MKRSIAAMFVGLLAGTSAWSAAPEALAKVAPWVLERTASGAQAEYLVVLRDQADLSAAAALQGKAAKGRFVYDTLYRHAQQSQAGLLADLRARGVEHRAYYIVNLIWVKGDQALALALAERDDVARIDGNPTIRNVLPSSDSAPEGIEPGATQAPGANITYVKAPAVWALGVTGAGIVVGGQDTGYDWNHAALRPHYRGWNGSSADHNYNWHDSVHSGGGVCGANSTQPCDDNAHGTHTMGTAIGDDGGTNQIGVAPGAKWIGCRNMDQGNGTPATYLECFEFFLAPYPLGQGPAQGDASKAPDVTNNSWGCPAAEGCNATSLLAAVQAQRAAGIVTVVSAGNSGSSCSTVSAPPSFHDEVFSVGALNTGADTLASFSSRGPVTADGSNRVKPDISAPGTNVRSSVPGGTYESTGWSGTSMAGPHVAGGVALLLSAVPSLSVSQVQQRLADTATRISTASCSSTAGVYPNNLFGFGRLDVLCAVSPIQVSTSIGVAGSTTIGSPLPCVGGTATVTDALAGVYGHQWGYRTVSGGAITNLPGQTGATYPLTCSHFPSPGTYFLVARSTSSCNSSVVVSNEISVSVNSTPVELQSLVIE